jgi:hypothetical protein
VPSKIIATTQWRRSSYCADGACVEIAEHGDDVLMRDSKHPEQPFLRFDRTTWRDFIDAVANGEF